MAKEPSKKKSNIGRILGAIGGLVGVITLCGVLIAFFQLWNGLKDTQNQEKSQGTLLAISGKQLEAQQTLVAFQQNPGSQERFQDIQATISALEIQRQAIEATLTPNSSIRQPSLFESAPTLTNIPEPYVTLPLEENFDNGLSSAWNILNGEPVIVDGKLQSAKGGLVIELRDKLPPNFSLQMDYDVLSSMWSENIIVTINDIRVVFSFMNLTWESFKDNSWVQITTPRELKIKGTMRLVVAGNKYVVYFNGNKFSEVIFGPNNNGQLLINLTTPNRTIDNLLITNP
jgi:hypothetical protein